MALFKPTITTNDKLSLLPLLNGQFIILSDENNQKIAIDTLVNNDVKRITYDFNHYNKGLYSTLNDITLNTFTIEKSAISGFSESGYNISGTNNGIIFDFPTTVSSLDFDEYIFNYKFILVFPNFNYINSDSEIKNIFTTPSEDNTFAIKIGNKNVVLCQSSDNTKFDLAYAYKNASSLLSPSSGNENLIFIGELLSMNISDINNEKANPIMVVHSGNISTSNDMYIYSLNEKINELKNTVAENEINWTILL